MKLISLYIPRFEWDYCSTCDGAGRVEDQDSDNGLTSFCDDCDGEGQITTEVEYNKKWDFPVKRN